MIDERKIKRELTELVSQAEEGTLEKKIFQAFLTYINRQRVIRPEDIRFAQRMGAVIRAAGRV